MTEPTIIPLYGFTAAQERAFHHVRLKRIADDTFTAGERHGLRLSIDDPVRRVKAYFDPWWRIHIQDGIGARGYLMEDLIEVAIMQNPEGVYAGSTYDTQVQIPWGPKGAGSVSAFDFLIHDPRTPVSVKSIDTGRSIEKLKPSAGNIRQEIRMLVEAGYPVGTTWHTWVGSLGQMQARGPFVHTLTAEPVEAYQSERVKVEQAYRYFQAVEGDAKDHPAWNDPDAWRELFALESTSGAFRFETLDASGAIEKRHRRAMQLKAEAKHVEIEAADALEQMKQHAREQIELARRTDPNVNRIKAYSGDKVATYTLRKDGAIVITERANDTAREAA